MVKLVLILFPILFFCSAVNVKSQTETDINSKRNELSSIKEEIASLESELKQKSKTERESLKALDKLNQQNLLLSKLVNGLKREESLKQAQIDSINSSISVTEANIKKLTDNYSKYIVWVYKHNGTQFWKYLLDAGSINQALMRIKYLNFITKKSKENVESLRKNKELLVSLKKVRKAELEEKEKLVIEKNNEQKVLVQKKLEKNSLIKNLRKDKKLLNAEIEDKRNAEILIRNMISKLIESERVRKTKEKEEKLLSKEKSTKNKKSTDNKVEVETEKTYSTYNYDSFESFAALKGKLNWPVKSGTIIRRFGENVNEKLKTVTLNYGIDIKTSANSSVSIVADGIVSAIDWIPGFGSVIIVTHKNDYRTVYGHVGDVSVSEGEKVKRGTVIGSVNESLEGNILHFEIWNDRNYQNPSAWLSK